MGELLWGSKHPSVLFVLCLAQGEASLDAGHSNAGKYSYSPHLLFERKVVLDQMVEGVHA